jgi:P27 family predicted phage terminase small subunit
MRRGDLKHSNLWSQRPPNRRALSHKSYEVSDINLYGERIMGKRGPLKGRGGRPPSNRAKSNSQGNQHQDNDKFSIVDDVSDLDFQQLTDMAGEFRPLRRSDQVILVLLTDAIQRYSRLKEDIKGKPLTFVNSNGFVGQLPQLGMLNKCVDQIIKLSAKFGMSPADRSRLGDDSEPAAKPTIDVDDPFEKHLRLVEVLSNSSEIDGEP